MKKLLLKQKWDKYVAHNYIYLEDDVIVGMYNVNYYYDNNECYKFDGFYVNDDYRGKGISHIMMRDIIDLGLKNLTCMVHKDNWVHELYEKYGFEWYHDDEDYENYYWMIRY